MVHPWAKLPGLACFVLLLAGCDGVDLMPQSTMTAEEVGEAARALEAAADEEARITEQALDRKSAQERLQSMDATAN